MGELQPDHSAGLSDALIVTFIGTQPAATATARGR